MSMAENLITQVRRLIVSLERRIKGRDLLEEIWHERDQADVEAIRERVKRLMVLEKSQRAAAEKMKKAGMVDAAKREFDKAEDIKTQRKGLLARLRRIEARIQRVNVAMDSRNYPHG